jgi:hypothetical protein
MIAGTPSGQVIYEESHSEGEALMRDFVDYESFIDRPYDGGDERSLYSFKGSDVRKFLDRPTLAIPAFVHSRSHGDSAARLVVVLMSTNDTVGEDETMPALSFECDVYQVATWDAPIRLLKSSTLSIPRGRHPDELDGIGNEANQFPWITEARVFAGQPDLSDPSLFTIALMVNGHRTILNGSLGADDMVFLGLQDGRHLTGRFWSLPPDWGTQAVREGDK